jgi:14-3-3 protein epsilon
MSSARDAKVYEAKLSEQAERYDDMVVCMRDVVKAEATELSVEERNLLSVAYKNVIGSRRASWRVLSSIEQREQQKASDSPRLHLMQKFRVQVEHEMKKVCNEVMDLLYKHLVPNAAAAEAKVYFLKMKGDYYRY